MTISQLMSNFGYPNFNLDNQIIPPELAFITSPDKRLIIDLTEKQQSELDAGYYMLLDYTNKVINITYKQFYENKILIHNQERKLFKYLIEEGILNRSQVEYISSFALPKVKLYAVLSVNYNDFLLCSTKNRGWSSCLNLENGDYSYSVLGSLFDQSRALFYLSDLNPKEYLGINSYNMFVRSWVYVCDDDSLRFVKMYPNNSEKAIIPSLIFGTEIKRFNKSRHTKYPMNTIMSTGGIMPIPYLDNSDLTKKKDGWHIKACEYGNLYTLAEKKTGIVKKIDADSAISYVDCINEKTKITDLLPRYCDCCGNHHISIHTFNGLNYCRSCFNETHFKCDYCNKNKNGSSIKMTIDHKIICNNCIKKHNYYKCNECRQYHEDDGKRCFYCKIDYNCKTLKCPDCRKSKVLYDIYGTTYYDNRNDNLYDVDVHKMLCCDCKDGYNQKHYTFDYEKGHYTLIA